MLDYDVVIIGGTLAGRKAAITATKMQGRVALVESSPPPSPEQILGPSSHQTFLQVAKVAEQMRQVSQFGVSWETADRSLPENILVQWDRTCQWARCVNANLEGLYSPGVLASHGVDVIFGQGEFVTKPRLGLAVNNRLLRSRTYLLAMGSKVKLPHINGLTLTGYLSADTIYKLPHIPNQVAVIGGDLSGVELAQAFSRFGSNVTLIVSSDHILSREDPQVAFLVQCLLESEGVRVLTKTPVTQAKQIDDTQWIQAGNQAIEVDQIILGTGRQPDFTGLNLEEAGVGFNDGYLMLNSQLQTTNPRIYACGEVAGGYPLSHISEYEAQIALKNALYWPRFPVSYDHVPWVIATDPPVARVGLTETQARRCYGDTIRVSRDSFQGVEKAQILSKTMGFFELVGHSDGRILGATIFGVGADELINIVAIAIQKNIKMDMIADFSTVWPTVMGVSSSTAANWIYERHRKPGFWYNCLENLFHWRRLWQS